ncbi:hypothetical protein H072_5495 [Dactylellina haptotyla CBS 200.50]|uniref:Uncharacterized protein n=1 Tax=Dactylellina haptotyla (strain CBS 200.50) TaxID=1284197 RepID=S8AC75_DACHA|nr:hypothetical protein H072_5495 [Dactylellina haptotyla CBS 200.50]
MSLRGSLFPFPSQTTHSCQALLLDTRVWQPLAHAMIRLGASQTLLTSRDVTCTLNPNRPRRPPTYLYTKGKQPVISTDFHLSASIPRHDTFHPITLAALSSSSPAPATANPSDWSVSSDSETDAINMTNLPPRITTDGTQDAPTDDTGTLRQIISLATIDSFPYLPLRGGTFRIHQEESETELHELEVMDDAGFDNFPSIRSTEIDSDVQGDNGRIYGGPVEQYDEDDGSGSEGEDDEGYDDEDDFTDNGEESQIDNGSVILIEALWDPNLVIIAPPRIPTPADQIMLARFGSQHGAEIFDTPPRHTY